MVGVGGVALVMCDDDCGLYLTDLLVQFLNDLIERYGKKCLYLIFPGMSLYDADKLMNYACRNWESGN